MSHVSHDWEQSFAHYFNAGLENYRRGHQKASGLLDGPGQAFLASIGHTEQEFFDFVEDFARGGEPTLATALQIAAVRRDYFLQEQHGVRSSRLVAGADLPAKDAEARGIPWLPRLLAKAEAKLRGEMPPELMYGCGGDRRFFKTHRIDPAEFLRRVWQAKGDSSEVVSWVKSKSG